MKKAFVIIGLILCVVGYPFRSMLVEVVTTTKDPIEDVREGDVIFQTSLSQQSPLIKMGTRSTITHCGVVVMKDGKPYVLETQKTLVLTPLKKFIARGKDGKYWHKRPKLDNIKIKYSGYLGKPYDLAFKFDNGKFYCSELIYDVYLNQLGVELCKPKKIDDYLILGTHRIPKIKRAMEKRGITMEQYAVAPVDLFNSSHFGGFGRVRP